MKTLWRLALALLVATVVFGSLFFVRIGSILSKADPVRQSDYVLCLTGGSSRIDKTAALLREHIVERAVMTTTGAYYQMLKRQVPPEQVIKPDRSATSTYEEALLLKKVLANRRCSVLVVSDPYHLYRARWTMRTIFAGAPVDFAFISSDAPSMQGFWWSSLESRIFVFSELPKILYYRVWHGWLGRGADDPQWAIDLDRRYMALVRTLVASSAKK